MKTIRNVALIKVPFQWNSWLALADINTKTNTATIKPIVGKRTPYAMTDPVMRPMTFQLKGGIFSIAALALSDFTKISKPKAVITRPSQKGKYPGPILAAVPIGYWVAMKVKKRPMTIYIRPAPKSFWLRISKLRSLITDLFVDLLMLSDCKAGYGDLV